MPFIDAKPFPFQFDFDHVALVCIDMQRDFLLPGGFADSLGNDLKNVQPCIPVIAKLQAAFRRISPTSRPPSSTAATPSKRSAISVLWDAY